VTVEDAQALDGADPLAFTRKRFRMPDGTIYLDGNSLGALPVATAERVRAAVEEEWGADLISSWTKHGWIDAPARVAAKLAPLVGAAPSELLFADSTSVCLFKLLGAAARARPGRRTILTDERNFPTDNYVAQGLAGMLGLELRAISAEQLRGAVDEGVAAITLSHVDYRSGARHDMAPINRAARAAGALTVWDLSHSAGAVELDLAASGCDLAVGCGYKYLNGGPGAPAFMFVAGRLQDELQPPLQGWMGHAEPFAFDASYRPGAGIARFLTGTPSILALAALEAGLDTFKGVSMADVEAKSAGLSQLFIAEVEARCGGEVQLASPSDAATLGSHVSFACPHGYAVMRALIAQGVVGDFRAPDLMRFGFAPLYNSFADVVRAAEILAEILATRSWNQPQFIERLRVT
jgi:kynureninase